MKYLCAIYSDESAWRNLSPQDSAAMMADYEAFGREAREAGVMLGGDGLQPTATATTVRVRDGERLLTDGPFAETKEQLGGFYLIDVGTLDEAIEWAAKIPGARYGSIEVRPVMIYDEAGASAAAAESHA